MRTRTVTKFVKNLTPDEYARCARLNLRFDGYMQEDLQRERHDKESSARVVMIKDTDSDMLIAWSLIFKYNEGVATHYYTRKNYRRKGYGSRLIRAVQKVAPKPIAFPGTDENRPFFKKHERLITVTNSYTIY
jgi:GNAT superfamily N-acetyltransferase